MGNIRMTLRLSSIAPIRTFSLRRPQTLRLRSTMATPPVDTRPIVLSGPSGVGKGTLYELLFRRHPDCFTLSVSHTTRTPRNVEHAKFGGNRYGTSKQTIQEQEKKGKVVLLDIEMEGVKQIKQSGIDARYIFVSPPEPAFETLEKRLRGRQTETEESLQKRLNQAKKELEFSKVSGVHDIIVVNDDLETAYKTL